ncbi:MAG TPA: hypothetical protein VJG83_06840 [archaeon]|nr:hypothetical protein [archaeon]
MPLKKPPRQRRGTGHVHLIGEFSSERKRLANLSDSAFISEVTAFLRKNGKLDGHRKFQLEQALASLKSLKNYTLLKKTTYNSTLKYFAPQEQERVRRYRKQRAAHLQLIRGKYSHIKVRKLTPIQDAKLEVDMRRAAARHRARKLLLRKD